MMRFSLPYLVAVSFVKGRVSPWEIDLSLAHDPEILAMIDKIECVEDDSMANPGHFPGSVSVIVADGSRYEKEERIEPGAPENPVPETEVREKFRNNAQPVLGEENMEKLSGVIGRFETIESMGELLVCLDRESRAL
jgi:2-methylcitrate dehydratase PrpD